MSDHTFGHYANEEDRPEPLCPYCGEHHSAGPCPGEEPEDWPLPAEPEWVADPGAADMPLWVYDQMLSRPTNN